MTAVNAASAAPIASAANADSAPSVRASLILSDCQVGDPLRPFLESVTWALLPGEAWAVVGRAGGGSDAFAAALAGRVRLAANPGGIVSNPFSGRAALVSFDAAADLLLKERREDDSDFAEGGVSEGTSVRSFVAAGLPPDEAGLYPGGDGLESHPAAVACGVAGFLDRGVKRLSTGECRRALLCRALASRPGLLVIADPYEGLDAESRAALRVTLDALAEASAGDDPGASALVIVDRLANLPPAVNRVVEIADSAIAWSGRREDYEILRGRRTETAASVAFLGAVPPVGSASAAPVAPASVALLGTVPVGSASAGATVGTDASAGEPLVELRSVTVSWSGRVVLDSLSWRVMRGEHWLVRGPNGSGKTTLLELVTGDHPQAYREDVRVFGRRRGSGGTIGELKARLGVASHRLHLEYRCLDDSTLEDVLVSGLRDTIGLYARASDGERAKARAWLALAGFDGRSRERFGGLSFGEQRALLVARAAIKPPELLVLDEPCHGLDDGQRGFVLSLMATVAARGESTLLHVTHDPDEVQPFERSVLELRPGRSPSWAVLRR